MKVSVIYFSATGGTEHIARLIAGEIPGAEAYDYTIRGYDASFGEEDIVFLCCPVYGGRMPSVMYDRISGLSGNGARAAVVAVYGNRAVDDALLEMADGMKARGFRVAGGCEMIAPHSLNKRFAENRPNAMDINILKQFIAGVINRPYHEPQLPGNRPYKKYDGVPVYPTSGSKCTGCGTCYNECPTGAIPYGDPKNTDHKKCISCMRCLSACPFGGRKLPAAMQLAATAALVNLCAGKKTPKYYL